MKSSCLYHEPKDLMAIVRRAYYRLTGDAVSASLISFFEYKANGYFANGGQEEEPWIDGLTIPDFEEALMGLSTDKQIRKRLSQLEEWGYIATKPAPTHNKAKLYQVRVNALNQDLKRLSNGDEELDRLSLRSNNRRVSGQITGENDQSLRSNNRRVSGQITGGLRSNNRRNDDRSLYLDLEVIKEEKKETPPYPPKGEFGTLSQAEGENFEDLKASDSQRQIQPDKGETSNPNPPAQNLNPEITPCLDSKKSGEDQKWRDQALIFSVPQETLERIKALYNSKKPSAWQPIGSLHQQLKNDIRGVIASEDFKCDTGAFLQRLEDALLELNHPATSFGWWRHQSDRRLQSLFSNGWLFQFSDAWTARQQKPENQEQPELPSYLKRLAAELELKKAG